MARVISTTRKPRVRRLVACPYCAGEIAVHPDSVLPHKPSSYFDRLRRADRLVMELAGMIRSVRRVQGWIEKTLSEWAVED